MGWCLRLLLVVYAIASCGVALAYPTPVDFDGSLTRWDIHLGDPPVTYEIVGADADVQAYSAAIQEAAGKWNDVSTSYFQYRLADPGEAAQVTIHLDSVLSGVTDSAGYTEFDKYNGTKPLHCSIHVEVDDGVSYYDTSKTFLHEMGHGLGLGHSLIPHAIMSYSLDQNEFALDTDDEAAVSRLYPADGSRPRLPLGCAVGAGQRSGPTRAAALVLLVLPAAAVTTLRLRGSRGQSPQAAGGEKKFSLSPRTLVSPPTPIASATAISWCRELPLCSISTQPPPGRKP